jgi:peptidyl-prolyl cis-trans isomerase D
MFETIRTHNRWLMPVLLLVIALPFVFTGVLPFTHLLGDNTVAKVDGSKISIQEFELAHRDRIERMMQMFGGKIDSALLDTPDARAATLDALLGDRALLREADKSHVEVSENRIKQAIASEPAFQKDGKFNLETASTLLAAQGMTELSYEQRLREALRKQDLLGGVAESSIAPRSVMAAMLQYESQQRDIREQLFKPEDYVKNVVLTDATVRARFDAEQKRFEVPESVKAEYLVLTLDDVAKDVAVPADQIVAYYEQNKSRWSTEEQRRASHILFTVGAGGSAPDKDGARKMAEETLVKVRANPGSFAALAKALSKDPGSAANGGDLGLFGRNMMVKPFEAVAFALKPGETSDVVETDFGFHIIRVTEVKPAQIKPLDDVRAEIEVEFRRQKAQQLFAERAEQFSNLVYEQSDSLKPAAERFHLQVQTIDTLTRQGPPARPNAPQLFVPKLLDALFSPDSIEKKRNTAAVEAATNTLVSARVLEHRPSSVKPFESIQASLRKQLEQEEAARLARAAGLARVAELTKSPDDAGLGPMQTVSRQEARGLSAAALGSIMRVPAAKLPAFVGVDREGGAFAVVKVLAARAPEKPDAEQQASMQRSWSQQFASADDFIYVQGLKRKHDAMVMRPELVRAVPASRPDAGK